MLEHRKRTRQEGAETILAAGATLGILGGVMSVLLAYRQVEWPFGIVWFVILAMVGLIALVYAWLNIVNGKEFACRLDEKDLECISPVPGCGESFKIALADIVAIERESWSDSYRWYIGDAAGNRYWLTANYDNPVDEFLVRIRELNPAVKDVESGPSQAGRAG